MRNSDNVDMNPNRNITTINNFKSDLIFFRKCISHVVRLTWNGVARQSRYLSFKRLDLQVGIADVRIQFKCMSGFTTDNGKFIMPLQEKLSYSKSFDHCDRLGFQNSFL